MSDFDGLVRDDKNPDPLPSEQTTFKKSSSKKGGIAGALGADDIGSFAGVRSS